MSNSIVNLGDLAKPIDTLINKISDATGVWYEPRRIRQKANAESDAAIISANAEAAVDKIKAESEIEISDLHRRAAQRWIKEEAKRQENIEDIIAQAVPDVNETAKPDEMECDWLANFFDKCRIVSDKEMQSLWAKVLAGEANVPGTYSKRTVNLLSDFDKSDAELFTQLCGFGWTIGGFAPLVFDEQAEIYNRHGINFRTLSHLENIGLVKITPISDFQGVNLPKRFVVHYYSKPLFLEMPKDANNRLDIGRILLTKTGRELAPICGSKPVDGFYEYMKDRWKQYVVGVEHTDLTKNEYAIPDDVDGFTESDQTVITFDG